jgi:hypothetical protein
MKVFTQTMRTFGTRLHAALYSPRGEAILRMDPDNNGTWIAGACKPLALALHDLTEWPLFGLYGASVRRGGSETYQHVFVGFGGYFVDAEGTWTEQEMRSHWFELERVSGRIETYVPFDGDLGACPVDQIEALKKLIAPLLEK